MLHSIGPRASPENLVDLFLECHQRIRTFVHLAEKVGRRYELPQPEVIDTCQRCERYFTEALPLHVEDEEKSLLPRLRGVGQDVNNALATMHEQHIEHEPLLRALLESLQSDRSEPDLRQHRELLTAGAAQLALELEKHLTLEEQIIFSAARSRMPLDAQDLVLQELRARRRPSTIRTT